MAEELHLDWDTVKALEKQYMREQLAKAGTPGRKVIGIDEIVDPQGAHLSHRGERSDARASDLVRRRGSLGSEHGPVLRVAGREEEREGFGWR